MGNGVCCCNRASTSVVVGLHRQVPNDEPIEAPVIAVNIPEVNPTTVDPITAAAQGFYVAQECSIENIAAATVQGNTTTAEASVLFVLTPRREQNLHESVVETPIGQHAHVFKYYCPLCMLYFKDIFKSTCCGNYSCLRCLTDYLHSKGISGPTTVEMLANNKDKLKQCSCPHCFTVGLEIELVLVHEEARDYTRNLGGSSSSSKKYISPVSPVKIGDSFEELKRKMLPYRIKDDCESFDDPRSAEGNDASTETEGQQHFEQSPSLSSTSPQIVQEILIEDIPNSEQILLPGSDGLDESVSSFATHVNLLSRFDDSAAALDSGEAVTPDVIGNY